MTRVRRRISSRHRGGMFPRTRGWSASQPGGLHQIAVGDPVHLNIHPGQQQQYLGHAYPSTGRLYKARSEGAIIDAISAGTGDVLSPTLTDAHQTRRGDYHITLKLNHLLRGAALDSASTGSYDQQAWGTLGDEASNTWNYRSGNSYQREPKPSVSLVDIALDSTAADRQPTTVALHSDERDGGDLQHWFRAYHQHHEATHGRPAPPINMAQDPEISTNIPKYNTNPPLSPGKDAAFSMQVNQTMRMDYKPNEKDEEPVPKVSDLFLDLFALSDLLPNLLHKKTRDKFYCKICPPFLTFSPF